MERDLFGDPPLDALAALFAMDAAKTAAYFPRDFGRVWVSVGIDECETNRPLFIALLVLAKQAKTGEAHSDPIVAELCAGLAGLAGLMVESTADYDWLVWHPSQVDDPPAGATHAADPTMYDVWIAVRCLCRTLHALLGFTGTLPPFGELFRSVITPLE